MKMKTQNTDHMRHNERSAKRQVHDINAFIKKLERSHGINLIAYLKALGKNKNKKKNQ